MFFGLGLIIVGAGGLFLVRKLFGYVNYLKRHGIETDAVVTKVTELGSYTISFRYNANGATYESNYETHRWQKEGDIIKIRYNPNNPLKYALVDSMGTGLGCGQFILIVGFIAMICGGITVLVLG